MQCPDCKHLRHPGPCEPQFEEPDILELLAVDAEMAVERYHREMERRDAEGLQGKSNA